MTAIARPSLEEEAANMEADAAKAEELMARDPKLPFISAFIMARDLRSADRSLQWLRDGTHPWGRAEVFCGSYGRLDLRIRALEEGLITPAQAYADLPSMWSGSDPDDSDPRFLALWKAARRAKRSKLLTDKPGLTLPTGFILTVYRGQDPMVDGERPGISWSLNRDVAQRFANGAATRQHHRNGVVYTAKVAYPYVIAYMVGRNEEEVIIDPKNLMDITIS